MPLFGGNRDISLFRTMNKELINDIIQTEIGFYKFVIQDSETGIIGVVDPSEFKPINSFIEKNSNKIDFILNTHHHFDHTGGNLE